MAGIVRSAGQTRFVTEELSRSPSLSPSVPSSATIVVDTGGRASSSLLFGGGLTTANHTPSIRKGFGSPPVGQYRLHSQQTGTPNGNHAHPGRANPSPPSQLNGAQNAYGSSSINISNNNTQQQQVQTAAATTTASAATTTTSAAAATNISNNSLFPSNNTNSHHAARNTPTPRWTPSHQLASGAQAGSPGLQGNNQSSFISNGFSSSNSHIVNNGSSSGGGGVNSQISNNNTTTTTSNNNNNNSNTFLNIGFSSTTGTNNTTSNSNNNSSSSGNTTQQRSSSNSSPTAAFINGITSSGRPGAGGASGGSGGPGTPRFKPSLGSLVGQDQDANLVFRKVRGILNKLTPENFDKLSRDLLNVGLDSTHVLKGVILLIFEKALDEAKYSLMYASLCKTLCEHAPNFDPPPANTFRRLLLAKCQDEFDNRKRAFQDAPINSEQRTVAKQKMLGNMRLIGELGKLGLLHEKILHECLQTLLRGKRQEDVDLECLCHMVRTVGLRLDTSKGRPLVDQYFERMVKLHNQEGLPSRIKFMLQDVCELRRDNWMPRRRAAVGNLQQPTTLAHIRSQLMPPPHSHHARHSPSMHSGGHPGGGHQSDHSSLLHGRSHHGLHRHRDNINSLGMGGMGNMGGSMGGGMGGMSGMSGGRGGIGSGSAGGSGGGGGGGGGGHMGGGGNMGMMGGGGMSGLSGLGMGGGSGSGGMGGLGMGVGSGGMGGMSSGNNNSSSGGGVGGHNNILSGTSSTTGGLGHMAGGCNGGGSASSNNNNNNSSSGNNNNNNSSSSSNAHHHHHQMQHDDILFNGPVGPLKKSSLSTTGPTTATDYFDLFDPKPSPIMGGSAGRDNRDRDNGSRPTVVGGHGRFGGPHNGHHNHRGDGVGGVGVGGVGVGVGVGGHRGDRDGGVPGVGGPFNNHGGGPRNGNPTLPISARIIKKTLPQQMDELLSLRPQGGTPPLLKPKAMPPPGAQLLSSHTLNPLNTLGPHSSSPALQPVSVKPTVATTPLPLPVKSEAKPRAASKAEYLEKATRLLAESKTDPTSACDKFAKLDIPRKFVNDILVALSQDVLKEEEEEQKQKEEDAGSMDVLEQLVTRFAPGSVADTMAALLRKLPASERAPQRAAELVARLLQRDALELADVAQWTDVTTTTTASSASANDNADKNNANANNNNDDTNDTTASSASSASSAPPPWIFSVLKLLLAREGEDALTARCRGVSLLPHLPAEARTKDELAAALERHGLACLQPLSVRLERQMAACLPSVEALQALIDGLDESTRTSPEFVLALVTATLRSVHRPDQAAEAAALAPLRTLLRRACAEQQGMWALYAAQELWVSMGGPRGLLLRWFNLLYQEDIVEEAEFMRWREDVADASLSAGKGKALFQVNQWLTWLQEADDDEDDADD